jgi:hypothetical protein
MEPRSVAPCSMRSKDARRRRRLSGHPVSIHGSRRAEVGEAFDGTERHRRRVAASLHATGKAPRSVQQSAPDAHFRDVQQGPMGAAVLRAQPGWGLSQFEWVRLMLHNHGRAQHIATALASGERVACLRAERILAADR